MRVRITRLTAIYPKGHFIQWTVEGAKDSGSYLFDISRSGGPDGPWELLAAAVADQYAYFDQFPQPTATDPSGYLRPNQLRLFRNYYYRVEVTTPAGQRLSAVEEVGPIIGQQEDDLRRRKMGQYHRRAIRNMSLALQQFVGTPVALLKRRVWGTRCKDCWDPISKEVIRANCTNCWSTGFEGGYWNPTLAYVRRGAGTSATQITPQQKSDSNEVTVWMLDMPAMERDDIIVFFDDQKRFRIDRQVQTEIRLQTVHQIFTCQEIDHSDIIYRFPVSQTQINPLF
jgi:hypothetical protein